MITHIRGILKSVAEESLTLAVEPFELEVLIPEHTRRQLQGKVGEPVTLHTIFYIEGNAMSGRMMPRLVGFLSAIDREFFDIFCSVDGVGVRKALAGDGPAGPRAGPDDPGPGRQDAGDLSRASARRRPSGSSPSCAQGRQVHPDRRPGRGRGRHGRRDQRRTPRMPSPT